MDLIFEILVILTSDFFREIITALRHNLNLTGDSASTFDLSIAYSRAKTYEIFTETAQTIVLKISFSEGRVFFLVSICRSPSESANSNVFEKLTSKLDDIRYKNPKS